MRASCDLCEYIQKKRHLVYEDEHVAALLAERPAVVGHILLMPKEHYPIIETVPDHIIGKLFTVANKLSTIAFETLKAEGTNLLVQNGVTAGQHNAHFLINIIPRAQGDEINFNWQAQELSDDQAETISLQIKEETKNIGGFQKEKQQSVQLDQKIETVEDDAETNYMIRQLRRIP